MLVMCHFTTPKSHLMISRILKYLSIFTLMVLLLWGCEEFFRRQIGGFAGSYPFVEYWDIKASEQEVVNAIIELKTQNPDLQPPYESELFFPRNSEYEWNSEEMKRYLNLQLRDSTLPLPPMTKNNTKSEYWLHVNFYYKDTNEELRTWTRPDVVDTTVTTFALVSVGENYINRDYWYVANKAEIRKFKVNVVDKLERIIKEKRKAAHNSW